MIRADMISSLFFFLDIAFDYLDESSIPKLSLNEMRTSSPTVLSETEWEDVDVAGYPGVHYFGKDLHVPGKQMRTPYSLKAHVDVMYCI